MMIAAQNRRFGLANCLLISLFFFSCSAFFAACSKPKNDEKPAAIEDIQEPNTLDVVNIEADSDASKPDGQDAFAEKAYEAPVKRAPIPRTYQPIRANKRKNPLLAYVPSSSFIVVASCAQLPIQSPQAEDFLSHIAQNFGKLLTQWPKSEAPQVRALQTLLSATLKSLSPHKLASLGIADGHLGDFVFYFADNMPVFRAELSDFAQFSKIFDSYLKRENIAAREDKINGLTWKFIDLPKPYHGFLAMQWSQTLTVTLVASDAQAKQQLAALSSPPLEGASNVESRFANYLNRDDLFAFVSINFDMFIDNFVGIANQFKAFVSYDGVTISPTCIKDLRFLAKLIPTLSIEISAFTGGPMLGFTAKCDVAIGEKTIRDRLLQMQGMRRQMPIKTYIPVMQVYASLDMARVQQILEHIKVILRREELSCSGLTALNTLLDVDEETFPEYESLWGERFDIGATIYEGSILNPMRMVAFVEAENAASIAEDMAWIEIPQTAKEDIKPNAGCIDDNVGEIANVGADTGDQETTIDYTNAKLTTKAIQLTLPKLPRQLRVRKDLVIAASHDDLASEVADVQSQTTSLLFESSISERGYIEDYDSTHDYHFDTKVEAFDMGMRFTLQYTLE